jgi:hypothetical protein
MAAALTPEVPRSELTPLSEECGALFPVPGVIERAWLYRSLGQIAHQVEWLQPLVGHYEVVECCRSLKIDQQNGVLLAEN